MRTLLFLIVSASLFGLVPFDQSMGEIHRKDTKIKIRLREVYQKNSFEVLRPSKQPLIPKIIHQIWLGGELPQRFKHFCATWKEVHPDWEYKLWTDDDIEEFGLECIDVYKASKNYGMKSDILRCEVLKRYGGVYVDTDFGAIQRLDPFIYANDFFAGMPDQKSICNAIIASAPNHPVINAMLDSIKTLKNPGKDIFSETGPILLTKKVMKYLKETPKHRMCIYPCSFFFPLPSRMHKDFWNGKVTPGQLNGLIKPESYAIHYWATSWM